MRIPSMIGACTAVTVLVFSQAATQAQTVQLPTFRVFSVNTTVKVPDGGRMHLGGVKRSSFGATSRGVPGLANIPGANRLFKNRAIGGEADVAGVDVTARIIILEELENELMGEAARQAALEGNRIDPSIEKKADFIARNVGRNKNYKR